MAKSVSYAVSCTLDQYHPSDLKTLWMILASRDDTAYDTDFAMYYSLYIYIIIYTNVVTCICNVMHFSDRDFP